MLWSVCGLILGLLVVSLHLDRRAWEDGRWDDDDFFTNDEAYRDDGKTRFQRLRQQLSLLGKPEVTEEPSLAVQKAVAAATRPGTAAAPGGPAPLKLPDSKHVGDSEAIR